MDENEQRIAAHELALIEVVAHLSRDHIDAGLKAIRAGLLIGISEDERAIRCQAMQLLPSPGDTPPRGESMRGAQRKGTRGPSAGHLFFALRVNPISAGRRAARLRHMLVVLLSVFPLAVLGKPYSLEPVRTPDVQVRYDRAAPVLLSIKRQGVIRVRPISNDLDGRMTFEIVAFNNSKATTNFGYESVAITSVDGTPIRVYDYDDLEREADKKANRRKVVLAFRSFANGYSDEQAGHSSVSGSVVNPFGPPSFYYKRTYDPGVTAALSGAHRAEENAEAEGIKDRLYATLANLDEITLQTTTIDPGGAAGGEIVAEKPKLAKGVSQRFDVVVQFNGEQHRFGFVAVEDGTRSEPSPAASADTLAPANAYFMAAAPMDGEIPGWAAPSGAAPPSVQALPAVSYRPANGRLAGGPSRALLRHPWNAAHRRYCLIVPSDPSQDRCRSDEQHTR